MKWEIRVKGVLAMVFVDAEALAAAIKDGWHTYEDINDLEWCSPDPPEWATGAVDFEDDDDVSAKEHAEWFIDYMIEKSLFVEAS